MFTENILSYFKLYFRDRSTTQNFLKIVCESNWTEFPPPPSNCQCSSVSALVSPHLECHCCPSLSSLIYVAVSGSCLLLYQLTRLFPRRHHTESLCFKSCEKSVTLVVFLFQMNSNPLARSRPETCCSSERQSIVFINIYKYTQHCIAVGAYWADFYKQCRFAAPSISIRKHYVFLYLLQPLFVYSNLVV